MFEHFTKKVPGIIYKPHINLATLHEKNGDDGTLLLRDLAALVQAIHNWLAQDEYKHTSLSPSR